MLRYVKLGNQKIGKKVGRFDLPTSVCGHQCPKCYAKKAEVQYPNTREYRQRCLSLSESTEFVETISAEITASKCSVFRPHCSGDFYSQEYVDKWVAIVKRHPKVRFFAWSKALGKFDFSKMPKNMNLMNSLTPLGLNYGDKTHVSKLVKDHGYFLCPDQGSHSICFHENGCTACLTKKHVCFLQH